MRRLKEDWITSFLHYSDNTEPPTIFREWCAISAIGAALQRKCCLDMGTRKLFPNLYVVLVAPAGKARKGTAMGLVRPFIDLIDIPLAAEATTREALIKRLKEAENITPTSIRPLIHSSLTIFSPELTVFLGYSNLQLISDLTDWFDCAEKWQYRTKNAGMEDIQGVFVNILGATTPDLIRSALPQDAVGGGLTSRIIFVYADRKEKMVAFPFLSERARELAKGLEQDIKDIYNLKGTFKMTASFIEGYTEWYMKSDTNHGLGRSYNKIFDGYIERRSTHLLKLCMIMSAARTGEMVLDLCDLDRAYDLLTRTEVRMNDAFGGYGTSVKAPMLYEISHILGLAGEPLTPKEILKRSVYNIGDLETVTTTLMTLYQIGMVTQEGGKYRLTKEPSENWTEGDHDGR